MITSSARQAVARDAQTWGRKDNHDGSYDRELGDHPASYSFDHWAPPPLFAGRPRNGVEMLLVRMVTSDGMVGWGEAYGGGWPGNVVAFDTWIKPLVLGQSATDADLTTRLERTLHNLGRAGAVVQALSGVDIALWDIRGKLEGVPVSTLLGGVRRKRIECYASLLQYAGKVDDVRRSTERALQRGFRHIKLHERTADTVAAAREVAGPDLPIMVDTNCAWTPDQATAAVLAMAPSKPFWVEEPIWPPEDFESAAALGGQPACRWRWARTPPACLITARWSRPAPPTSFSRASSRSADYQPLAHRNACRKGRRRLRAECVLSRAGLSRYLHALAAKERETTIERFFADLGFTPYAKTVPVVDGAIEVPEGPGFGAEPEPELIERFRIAH